jgi:signal transduction histidine kinase
MKVARRISLALAFLAILVITGLELVQVQLELRRSAEDMRHDHRLLGHTLGGSLTNAWQPEGERDALTLLSQANRFQTQVQLGWLWLDGPEAQGLPASQLQSLRAGQDTWVLEEQPAPGLLRSYTPVSLEGRPGAIILTEQLTEQHLHVRNTVLGTALATLFIALAFLAVAMDMGRRMVGYPVEQLVNLARRIGEGDLEARVTLRQRDELDTLAEAMNQMAAALASARAAVAEETAARLATLEHLRHADRLSTVGKLASGVAHELGTPLNVVLGRARMVASGEAQGPEVQECAEIIVQQVQHMTGIIRHLLDFSRRGTPHRAQEELTGLVTQTLKLLQPLAARRNITLVCEKDGPVNLRVDAGQIRHALTNLIVNGMQAMKHPGTLRVRLGMTRATSPVDLGSEEAEWVRVDVVDEGEGIAPDVLPHIFEPFFTTKEVGEGTGLGLSVSYGLVRDHGGWISVSSEPGQGSCFSIFLPREDKA